MWKERPVAVLGICREVTPEGRGSGGRSVAPCVTLAPEVDMVENKKSLEVVGIVEFENWDICKGRTALPDMKKESPVAIRPASRWINRRSNNRNRHMRGNCNAWKSRP